MQKTSCNFWKDELHQRNNRLWDLLQNCGWLLQMPGEQNRSEAIQARQKATSCLIGDEHGQSSQKKKLWNSRIIYCRWWRNNGLFPHNVISCRMWHSFPETYESNLFHQDFVHSENSVRDIKPFCCPLFCHSSVVKYTLSPLSSKAVMSLDSQLLPTSPPHNLTSWVRPCFLVRKSPTDRELKVIYLNPSDRRSVQLISANRVTPRFRARS